MTRQTKDVRGDYLSPLKFLTIQEIQRLRQFVKSEADRARKHGSRRGLVNEMIVELLLTSGIRSQELCHLTLRDLPTWHGKDCILVRKGKGQESRVVLISPGLQKKMKEFTKLCRPGAKPGSPLFASEAGYRLLRTRTKKNNEWIIVKEYTSRMSYMSLYGRIKRIARDVGIPHLTPHPLRHTYGSYLYATERDISAVAKQLGHKSLSSTQIYVGVIDDSIRQQVSELDQLYDDNHSIL